jgi:hypothetical protein
MAADNLDVPPVEVFLVVVASIGTLVFTFAAMAEPKLTRSYVSMGVSAAIVVCCFCFSRMKRQLLLAIPLILFARLVVGLAIRLLSV